MRNTLRLKLFVALLIVLAVPCMNAQVAHVGDILCATGVYVSPEDYEASGLEAKGVVFYVDATGQHGWAVALEDAGIYSLGTKDYPLPNFGSKRAAIYDLDGQFNTQEVLSYGMSTLYSFPGFEAMDVANGWYLPAIGQLNYLYGNLVEVNASLAVVGGVPFEMTGSWEYWSSTKSAAGVAWTLKSSGDLVAANYASAYNNTRAIRSVCSF